jgi:hypothetical protein
VKLWDPAAGRFLESSCGKQDVEVAVEFQVSSKCVLYNNNEDISSILHVDPLLDHGSTKGGQVVKEVTVLPKDRPEFARHGEHDA